MTYRNDIDGLRAIAVLPVILYHVGLGFSGGFLGVDVFFVISGYLITGILLKDMAAGSFSLARFWERRIRRIFPALTVVTLASMIAAWFLLFPDDFVDFGKSALAQVFGVANIHFWMGSGYFEGASELKPFLHYWSLAVEEQFYVVLPFLLMGLFKFVRVRLTQVIFLLLLGSALVGFVATWYKPGASYFLLPSRAWELLAGSLLAVRQFSSNAKEETLVRNQILCEVIAALSFVVLSVCYFAYNTSTHFPGLGALIPVLATSLIIWSAERNQTIVSKFLSLSPIVFIGKISYSLYLWHWPLIVFHKHWKLEPASPLEQGLLVVASFGFAILSYYLVESPFRGKKIFTRRSSVFKAFAATSGLVTALGVCILANQGYKTRIAEEHLRFAEKMFEVDPNFKNSSLEDIRRGNILSLGKSNPGKEDTSKRTDLIVWGDSHALALLPVLNQVAEKSSAKILYSCYEGIVPLVDYETTNPSKDLKKLSLPLNEAVASYIEKHKPRNVLLIAYWTQGSIETEKGWDYFAEKLEKTAKRMLETGTNVYIMRTVPVYVGDLPKKLVQSSKAGRDLRSAGMAVDHYHERSSHQDRAFSIVEKLGVKLLDPEPYLTDEGRCIVVHDDEPVYFDNMHLTINGSQLVKPMFEDFIESCE
ncbi:acyltransferase [Puniceicoccaceae bacterium K14]|nr:acyltransferase [Puniceicoccaceae bacterium K14]